MKLKKVKNVPLEEVSMFGSSGTTIQWLWSKEEAPHFSLRRFLIKPSGEIGLHSHVEEHEIFILSGEGIVFNDSGEEFHIQPEDTLFVPSDEPHGYRNTGKTDLIFLCIIPFLLEK
ncbi:MAG: cupin domain-containing protein [Candidatus Hodarchaeales archaeon]|jgi:quercetin dioxygenase-like cupin family protein